MKWSKIGPDEDLAHRDQNNLNRIQILITICEEDFHDAEVLQSAEIIYRELNARGLKTLFDDRGDAVVASIHPSEIILKVPLKIEVSGRGLSEGGWVVLEERATGVLHQLLLEDTVEKAEELIIGREF